MCMFSSPPPAPPPPPPSAADTIAAQQKSAQEANAAATAKSQRTGQMTLVNPRTGFLGVGNTLGADSKLGAQ
jgi:hypothetical protein